MTTAVSGYCSLVSERNASFSNDTLISSNRSAQPGNGRFLSFPSLPFTTEFRFPHSHLFDGNPAAPPNFCHENFMRPAVRAPPAGRTGIHPRIDQHLGSSPKKALRGEGLAGIVPPRRCLTGSGCRALHRSIGCAPVRRGLRRRAPARRCPGCSPANDWRRRAKAPGARCRTRAPAP